MNLSFSAEVYDEISKGSSKSIWISILFLVKSVMFQLNFFSLSLSALSYSSTFSMALNLMKSNNSAGESSPMVSLRTRLSVKLGTFITFENASWIAPDLETSLNVTVGFSTSMFLYSSRSSYIYSVANMNISASSYVSSISGSNSSKTEDSS